MADRQSVILWLLNRCVDWDPSFIIAHLEAGGFRVSVGQRLTAQGARAAPAVTDTGNPIVKMAVNIDEEGKPGELMHEGKAVPKGQRPKYDEYFVPILNKCVGARGPGFWDIASPRGLDRLAEIGANLGARFPPDGNFDATVAKAHVGPSFGDVKLNFSTTGMGYYQLLQEASARSGGAENVLVGYSQGGTVARYLAFLDEHVSSRRCIHSVITVQSPNRGSPVASPAKRDELSRAFIAILLSLPQWLPPDFRNQEIWRYLAAAEKQASLINFVTGLLDAQLASWPDVPANGQKRDTWLTARKWLSGLSGIKDLAFWDLDPARITEAGSVLQAIDGHPLQAVKHGAVIGTDNDIFDLVRAGLHGTNEFIKLLESLASGFIRTLLAQSGDIYKNDALSFPAATPGAVAVEYLRGLPAGADGLAAGLAALAHDFVIPSASQLLLPAPSPAHLGHEVNPFANHLSGAACWGDWTDADENDQAKVGKLLDRLSPPQVESPVAA